ncbi:MAG: UDP-N-acetylmuramoyl-L-alanyl-D-glutamate--2,6-diaminopimelate ligase [Ignavibacteria bacterium]|jgi:UDP-N-acetylmuramyl-tripeptide synthetase
MELARLLDAIAGETVDVLGHLDELSALNIQNVTSDSRQVRQDSIFVAIKGTNFNGHAALSEAIERGAQALIVEELPTSPLPVPTVKVRDSRLAYSMLTVELQGHPGDRLRAYGVTGTNGKTTCATLLEQLYSAAGRNVGFIGTTGNRYNGAQYPTNYSTPHAGELARLFHEMADAGVDTISMEVSSHALDQHRVHGIRYHGAIFTNLTRDHLDYHGTMESYAKSKKRLFDGLETDAIAVLWGESEWTPYMKRHCEAGTVVTVGTSAGNQVIVRDVHLGVTGTSFTLVRNGTELLQLPAEVTICTRLLGEFNVANASLVAVMAMLDGIPAGRVATIMADLHGPKGRMEVYYTPTGATAIVDYAHTPDALENVLQVVRGFLGTDAHGRQLHVVFGCGGNRDKGKRSEMGRIATVFADRVYVTTDNPRNERPEDIVNNIMGGVDGAHFNKVAAIEDRRAAIAAALDAAGAEDVVVIAGKGHEEYQIIGDQRIPFSDADEILSWSAKHKKAHQ